MGSYRTFLASPGSTGHGVQGFPRRLAEPPNRRYTNFMRQDNVIPGVGSISSIAPSAVNDAVPVTMEILRAQYPGSVDQAVAIFGSPTKAMDWLTTPCGALENQIPLDLLIRGDVEAVETELGRIEYGIYV